MPKPDPTDMVTMRLKGTKPETPAVTTRAAYDEHWSSKGFELVDAAADAPTPTEGAAK